MVLHLEPERIVFTLVSLLGLGARLVFLYVAFVHADRLRRHRIASGLREQIGPHWESEAVFTYIMSIGALLGAVSFTAPVAPRTLFSVIASVTFTGIIVGIIIVDWKGYRRRVQVLNGKPKH